MYLKSAAKCFFSSYFNKYSLDLSKYAKIIHFGQQAAELCAPKVGGQKKSQTFWVRGYVLCSSARENTRENQKGQSGRTFRVHSFVTT